jgi:hypothetical protein
MMKAKNSLIFLFTLTAYNLLLIYTLNHASEIMLIKILPIISLQLILILSRLIRMLKNPGIDNLEFNSLEKPILIVIILIILLLIAGVIMNNPFVAGR